MITEGDKATYLGDKINHLRAQLGLLGVMKSDSQATRLLISCMKECRCDTLDFMWKREEVKREQEMNVSCFLAETSRVFGSMDHLFELKEASVPSATIVILRKNADTSRSSASIVKKLDTLAESVRNERRLKKP